MSLALVKQALEFVEQEEGAQSSEKNSKHKSTGAIKRGSRDQAQSHQYRNKTKKIKRQSKPEEQKIKENIKKLLALSAPVADKATTKTIIKRAVKGKPLIEDKIDVKNVEKEKSILFPEEEVKPVRKFRRK